MTKATPPPKFKVSFAEMDKATKKKAILALSVLILAICWLIIWFGVLNDSKPKPPSAEKTAELMKENEAEQIKIQQTETTTWKNRKPVKPSGS